MPAGSVSRTITSPVVARLPTFVIASVQKACVPSVNVAPVCDLSSAMSGAAE